MTTPSTPREPWDDARLGAAFTARASRTTTPVDLAGATRLALRTPPVISPVWRGLLAPVAVVVLAIGVIGSGVLLRGDDPSAATPSSSPPGGSAAASDSASAGPPTAFGLPIISVTDAIAMRDAAIDDREIAVRGWFDPGPPVSCPAPLEPATSPVQPVCPDQFIWLTEAPESLTTVEPNSLSRQPPTGAAIHPDLDLVDERWAPRLPRAGPSIPVAVVFIGHFDDRRAHLCPAADEQACRDRFVVDRVDWVDGETQPMSAVVTMDGATISNAEEIASAARGRARDSTILSVYAIDGPDGLARQEPMAARDALDLTEYAVIWGARALEGGYVTTYLIPDGADAIYRVDSIVTVQVAPRRTFEPRPPATPPAAQTVLGIPLISVPELIARRAAGPSPDEVAVRGWIARSNVIYDCAIQMDPHHPLIPFCDPPIFLMERSEQPDGVSTQGPSVAVIIGPDANEDVPITWVDPHEVVAIGHLADHRWPTCPASTQLACRREFVVDRIVAAGSSGEEVPEPWRYDGGSAADPAVEPGEAIRKLETLVGDVTVLSLGFAEGGVLHEIEPFLGNRDNVDASFEDQPRWVVRALVVAGPDPAVARTFLMPDFSVGKAPITVWEVSESGVTPLRERPGVTPPESQSPGAS